MYFDWRKIVGTAVVLILAAVLIVLTIRTLNTVPEGGYEAVTRAGDWVYDGAGYNARDLTTVLFIGVGDGNNYGSEQDVRYLTLLAIDEEAGTYSLLHLDPDTEATVSVINENGSRVADPRTACLSEAQKYGNGGVSSCMNTVYSVEALLHNTEIDHYVCVRTGAAAPAFTNSPADAMTTLMEEMENAAAGKQTTPEGDIIEYEYTTVVTDMNLDRVKACCRSLNLAVCEADEAFRGAYENGVFVPDKEQSDNVISRLYFKKNN